MIEPNSLFHVWSPDEVAECLNGVGSDLYAALWQMVRHYDGSAQSEVPDDFGDRCLANWWDELTPDQQQLLNELAAKHKEAWR